MFIKTKLKKRKFPVKIVTRSMNKNSITKLNNDLLKINWSDLYQTTDVDKAYNTFVETLKNIFEKHLYNSKI